VTATGAVIMSVFAAIWWLVGGRASAFPAVVTFGVPLLVSGTMLVLAWRGSSAGNSVPAPNAGRVVGIASAVEGVVIFVAANVLVNTGHADWTAPAVAIIVGLHFLPIARWLPARSYYLTAALLVAVGAASLALPAGRPRTTVVTVGAACILWLTSAAVLFGLRSAPRARA
jgi:hypothetical protein